MDTATQLIKETLKLRGLKCTPARRAMMEVFLKLPGQLYKAQDIYDLLRRQGLHLNFSTVYRNLEHLVQTGLVEKFNLENTTQYILRDKSSHLHHMICTTCHKTQPLPYCPVGELEASLLKANGFLPTAHRIEIYGFCRECQARPRNH